ncbi:DUF4249 family protein [Spirosoma sp. HMF4905]|uniref:DUF4249 family protein n=1 Tax=Spirosoma arboris TaxID=2682092 RepID=A0A7K1SP78_9BACT|nr:DUF4249 family protein [Spirosoma arboris]
MATFLSLLSLLVGLSACVDPVALPIRQIERRLVVDGLITDEAPPYLIKLTYSGNLTGSLLIPEELAVNGAEATVSDNTGRTVSLEQDALNPAYYWLRDPTFRGQPGRSYTLSVKLPDGSHYQSRSEPLQAVAPLDPLDAQYYRQIRELGQPDIYQIRVDTQDPPTPGNFYRWEAQSYLPRWAKSDPLHAPPTPPGERPQVCNTCSCWVPYLGPLTEVLSDERINGHRISGRLVLSSPIYAVGNQYVQVRQYSLSRGAYQYWLLFEQQRSRSGSLFDPQPASIEGNVRAMSDTTILALGYFGASAVSQQRLTIPGDTININWFLNQFGSRFIPEKQDCFQAYPQAQLTPPSGYPPR